MARKPDPEFHDYLHKLAQKKQFATFSLGTDSEESVSGFVLGLSERFLLLQVGYQKDGAGFMVLALDFIEKAKNVVFDTNMDLVQVQEGLREDALIVEKIDLSSWKTVLGSLQALGFPVIAEGWRRGETLFYVGPITKIGIRSVFIRHREAPENGEVHVVKFKYRYLERVTFGDTYSVGFRADG